MIMHMTIVIVMANIFEKNDGDGDNVDSNDNNKK